MIALGPSGPFKGVGAKGNDNYWHEQSEKGDAVDSEDGHVMSDVDGVRNAGERRISLRLNAKIIVAGRDAREHDVVILLALSPGTVAVVAGVVTHFAADVPGLPTVLIDERIVQINPMVADRSVGFHLHGGSAAGKFERIGDERGLAFCLSAIVLIGLMKEGLFFRAHIKTSHEHQQE